MDGLGERFKIVQRRGVLGLEQRIVDGRDGLQAVDLEARDLESGHLGEDAHLRSIALDARFDGGLRPTASLWPDSRPARMSEAAMRFRSHSKGPRMVSSKSLMSKTRRPSGAAKAPRLRTWASPQIWLMMPVLGRTDRSAAMTGTAPRK